MPIISCPNCNKLIDVDGFYEHGISTLFYCECGKIYDMRDFMVFTEIPNSDVNLDNILNYPSNVYSSDCMSKGVFIRRDRMKKAWIKDALVSLGLEMKIEEYPSYFSELNCDIYISGQGENDLSDVEIGTLNATFVNFFRCYNDNISILDIADSRSQSFFDMIKSIIDPKINNVYEEIDCVIGDGSFRDILIINNVEIDSGYQGYDFDLKAVMLLMLQLGYSSTTIIQVDEKYEKYWKKIGFKKFNIVGIPILALSDLESDMINSMLKCN